MSRKATEQDLWNGKIVAVWVQKPKSYVPTAEIAQADIEEIEEILRRTFGGKFTVLVEPDTKEVVDGA